MTHNGEILVVDDNLASLKLLTEILTAEGYLVRPANSGKVALDSANVRPPQLILLDIRMEGLDGFAVLNKLKESEKNRETPIIFLSAVTETEQRVEGLRLGAVDFISKPFKKEELLARVAVHVEISQLNEQLKQQTLELKDTVTRLKVENEERKKAEAALHLLNSELEKRVADRTAHLEAANNELTAFAYSISHDLKIPVRAIASFSQILSDEYCSVLDKEGQRLLSVIQKNTTRLDALIDDILLLLRISQNQLNPEPVDMDDLVRVVFAETTTPAQQEKVIFHVQPLAQAFADPMMMRMVWVQLISNAIKFSQSRNSPCIEVSSKFENEMITYTIQDNGVGFNPKYYAKLFGLFERLHKVGEYEGKGVGLAFVKRIIERHSGKVWAESETGKGAAFHFAIPGKKDLP